VPQSADGHAETVAVVPLSQSETAAFIATTATSPANAPSPSPQASVSLSGSTNQPATAWFYSLSGQTTGPVSEDTLHTLANAGILHPDDLVWPAGATSSLPAAHSPVLADVYAKKYAAAPKAQTPPPPVHHSDVQPSASWPASPPPSAPTPPRVVRKKSGLLRKLLVGCATVVFLLIGLCVVVAVVDTVSTQSKSNQSRIAENETLTIYALKSISAGQNNYKRNNWGANNLSRGRGRTARGFCPEIAGLLTDLNAQGQPIRQVSEEIAAAAGGAITERNANAYKGYIFVESKVPPLNNVPSGWQNEFAVYAYPSDYGRTGVNTYWINEAGWVLMMDLGRAATEAASGTEDTSSWEPAE